MYLEYLDIECQKARRNRLLDSESERSKNNLNRLENELVNLYLIGTRTFNFSICGPVQGYTRSPVNREEGSGSDKL